MEAEAYWFLSHQCITDIIEPKVIAGSCLDTKRVKLTEKPQKNGKLSCSKRLVKQRKHYLSLAGKSFIKRENIKRKREAGNIRRKREVSGQNVGVGISVFIGSDRSNISQSFSRPLIYTREPAINVAESNFLD